MSSTEAPHPVPEGQAFVIRQFRGRPLHRDGRGFSLNELKEAKVPVGTARKLGICIDARRRTSHEANLRLLEGILARSAKSPSTHTAAT